MTGAVDRNAACSVKWCDETGTHAVHRKYIASLPAGLRGAGLVGVNLAQRVQPRATVCVELTVTTPWASTAGHLFAASCVADIAVALTEAAERATELHAIRQGNNE
ncbi:hypothetical protein E1262_28090 [Jiangella aurantiaca]|uniref:Uncharacterized protein n=1 Tax=Jiangella aurantiaca TaxID=2530373 RepID=A0A4V6PEC5_9ACTN|nr:hypothetical protein [Jiangella aurantiaca]TDD64507.1 hypothetical protein E1262_28090 [Jiangella aurantiaca]